MAFRKRYTSKRKFTRRRKTGTAWYNKRYSALQLAAKAAKGVYYLKGLVNSEMFKKDTFINNIPTNDSGSVEHLTALAIGDTDSTRTGNSILLRYVNIRGTLRAGGADAYSIGPQTVRLMLIQDKQQITDTTPTAAQILQNTTGPSAPFSFLNNETVGRFSVLWSRRYTLNQQIPSINFSCTKSFRTHVRYNGSASTDIQKNGLYFLRISDMDSSDYYPTISYATRISFHDN